MAAVSLFLSTCIGGPLRTTFKKAGREPLQTTKQHRAPKPSEDFSVPWKQERGEDTNQHSEAMMEVARTKKGSRWCLQSKTLQSGMQKEETSKQTQFEKNKRKSSTMTKPTQASSAGKMASLPRRQQIQGQVSKMFNPMTRRNRPRTSSHFSNQNDSFDEVMKAMDDYEEEDFDSSWRVIASATTTKKEKQQNQQQCICISSISRPKKTVFGNIRQWSEATIDRSIIIRSNMEWRFRFVDIVKRC